MADRLVSVPLTSSDLEGQGKSQIFLWRSGGVTPGKFLKTHAKSSILVSSALMSSRGRVYPSKPQACQGLNLSLVEYRLSNVNVNVKQT